MKLAKTYGFLKKDLDRIEISLQNAIEANDPILRKASTQLLKAGGKRIRPVFVLLSSKLGDTVRKDLITNVAVTIELIHMATLVHDDVIDYATLRRGKPTIRYQYDNRIAMYTGDYILASALECITLIDEPAIHAVLSKTIVEVCVGEIEQINEKYKWDQGFKDYLRRIKRKTAILIATCCKLGGIVADLPKELTHHLYKYGYYVGMSYQIIDDILDFTASEKQLGKPAGNDLLQGNITLPVLIAMENTSFKQYIKQKIEHPEIITKEEINEIVQFMEREDAFESAYKISEQYLNKALKSLAHFPDHDMKEVLMDLAKFIGNRKN